MGPTTPIPNSANGGKLHAKPGRRPHHAAKNEGLRCSIRQPGVERRGSVNTGKYSVLWCGHKGEASQTPRISFERVAIVPC